MKTFYIKCDLYETEDKRFPKIWGITDSSVPGLNLEGVTISEVLERAALAIPMLLELNGDKGPICKSCEDRCGGLEIYHYCPCCASFIETAPQGWERK